MHFSILTVASASILAAGTNAIDVSEAPGYKAIPTASTNKYLNDAGPAIPDFAVNSLEPTYMPEEDLYPSSIIARSLTSTPTTVSAASVSNEPADESFEAFLKWMQLRQAQGYLDQDEHTKVARDATSTSAQQTQFTDGPVDGSSRQQSRAGSRRRLNGYESNIVDAYDDRSLDPSSNESLIDEAKRLANEYHALFNEDTKSHSNRKHMKCKQSIDDSDSFSAFYQRINADAEQLAREHNKPESKVTFEMNTLPIFGHHVRKSSITAIGGLSSVIENIKQRRPSFPIIGAPQPISAAEAYNPGGSQENDQDGAD
ncbi:hypothetical protein E4T38_06599 [Aureobasidium subglaciale]|nr:hypothetical protein E4T38_06599 [Aureobasidium subglaciale]KAI5218960.1 hypothetical protein E4T40_06718 [Aureobasidium subglaciale]KAI5222634.1 hypothetical protein E4T41_06539 [Aureobasidium subglaciale]KAI5260218.1 hypothetical protein E4T46_06251 [Aureobasidium subglaciale]